MLEAYWAFADFELMANLVEELICHLAETVRGSLSIEHKDAAGKSPAPSTSPGHGGARLIATSSARQRGRIGSNSRPTQRRTRAAQLGVEIAPGVRRFRSHPARLRETGRGEDLQSPFRHPLPEGTGPARPTEHSAIPSTVDVYELIINGQEISPGYSELNDPVVQRERLEHQAGEEKQNIDEDFLTALEHGMPPAGGIGIGIDRLVMMLTGAESIRDVIFFPHLKKQS